MEYSARISFATAKQTESTALHN